MNEMKKCPTCDNRFVAKRLNQKYCSDNCRIQKNNEKGRGFRELTKETNHILLNNRNILAVLVGRKISKIDLKIKGFKFGYITKFEWNEVTKQTIFFCYDYGYFEIEKGELIAVVKIRSQN
jgi:reverse gyrase